MRALADAIDDHAAHLSQILQDLLEVGIVSLNRLLSLPQAADAARAGESEGLSVLPSFVHAHNSVFCLQSPSLSIPDAQCPLPGAHASTGKGREEFLSAAPNLQMRRTAGRIRDSKSLVGASPKFFHPGREALVRSS
jgi:hypothetical protein